MAKSKTPAAKTAAAPAPAPVAAPAAAPAAKTAPAKDAKTAPAKDAKVPLAKMRGPRGVAETAVIKLLADKNPKREGSKAHGVFSLYKDGMTVGQFCDAVDATDHKGTATPNLVYDAGHGFISIVGYEPPGGVITPKPKAEPKPKAAPKEAKGKATPKAPASKAAADADAKEEVID